MDDEESDVMRKMESDDLKNGETRGFPQLKALIQILKPKFSEEGSNSRVENSVYSAYLKYLRAVASKYEYASY